MSSNLTALVSSYRHKVRWKPNIVVFKLPLLSLLLSALLSKYLAGTCCGRVRAYRKAVESHLICWMQPLLKSTSFEGKLVCPACANPEGFARAESRPIRSLQDRAYIPSDI